MADENKPAFYPRVGRNIAKNFRSAQPPAFIEDPRAMELPQFGDVDLSVPSRDNLEMARRMAEREAQLKRQQQADRSPLEKLAGGVQAGRFLGSALTQAVNSAPTRLFKGDEAADKFMQERIYKPEQPLAYEYAGDIGDFLEKLETEYKIPPVLPEAVALQFLTAPATSQAARAAGKGAEKAGMAVERSMEPVVKGALERGGLPREMAMAMGANTQSNVLKQRGGNYLGGERIMTPERYIERLMTPTFAGETPAQRIPHHEALLTDPFLTPDQRDRVQSMLNVTKGEAALDQWAKSNLLNYYKNDLATPNDPVRQFIDKNYADIKAKYAKDQERAARMAERAALEPDPRRKANLTRQAQTMRNDAQSDYQLAMDNVTHLPKEDLADVDLTAPYLLAERKREGYPEQGMGVSDPAKRYETLADETLKISRAGDLQRTVDIDSQVQQSTNELRTVEDKINNAWTDFLRGKGLDEQTVITLNKMPTFEKAQNLGMADELQLAQNKQGQFFQINNSFDANAMRDNPFVSKLDPETKLYTGSMYGLGFDHVMDVLRQDVAEGRIRPEQLNKLSVEQAVRRTAEYNLERAKTMRDAKLIQQEGFTTYKDYPDQGYKWIELAVPEPLLPENYKILPDITNYKNPDNELYSIVDGNGNVLSTGATEAEAKKLFKRKDREQQLADALKYEGDTMGHCVGGYCPDVISGRSKIYSLRDAKGEPHVTIEVVPNQHLDYNTWFNKQPEEIQNRIAQRRIQDKNHDVYEGPEYLAAREALPPKIKQIKGKQNAKPKDDYLPFVQDFVRGGNWSDVRDFQNTGLDWRATGPQGIFMQDDVKALEQAGYKVPKYLTTAEKDDLAGKLYELQTGKDYKTGLPKEPPAAGMKAGGKVSISNNPDTMMLEVNNQKMKNGVPAYSGAGLIKGGLKAARPAISEAERALPLRLPRAMPKSNAEINAHAERVARQMLGEHVTSGKAGDTKNLAGRSLKESQRVKKLEYEFVPTKDVPESQPIQSQIGDINVALPGDFTVSDVELKSLMGEPINSRQEGGSRYGLGHLEDELPLFYASNEGPAQMVQDKVSDLYSLYEPERVMGQHMAMGPIATNFAQHFADANLKYTDYSKLRGADMDMFDQIMSQGYEVKKKNKKTGEVTIKIVDFPTWPGIADPQAAYEAMKRNPEMRKFYNRIMQTPSITEPLGFPSGQDVRYAITSPDLRDMEVNLTGHGVGQLFPNVDLTDTADHNTYAKGIRGIYKGHQDVLSPFAISYPDATQHIITHQRPQDFTGTIQKVFPHQRVDQQFIDEMEQYRRRLKELTGKKKGGAVEKAEGGYIKKPAAYIDGNEFVLAAQKYGIKDSMNNLNKIVDLVNKGLSVDDAARQVADTGMHKAAGGAIRGDDLILEERPL